MILLSLSRNCGSTSCTIPSSSEKLRTWVACIKKLQLQRSIVFLGLSLTACLRPPRIRLLHILMQTMMTVAMILIEVSSKEKNIDQQIDMRHRRWLQRWGYVLANDHLCFSVVTLIPTRQSSVSPQLNLYTVRFRKKSETCTETRQRTVLGVSFVFTNIVLCAASSDFALRSSHVLAITTIPG